MLNTATGSIHLPHQNLTLHPGLTPTELEERAENLIFFRYETDNHYLHIFLWLDVTPGTYVSTSLCFHENRLVFVQFSPQHITSHPVGRPTPMELPEARAIVRAWYGVYFPQTETNFLWGSIGCFDGSDPLDHPPCVVIRYAD